MNTIPTQTRLRMADKIRARYLRWRLDHVEQDITSLETNAKLARMEAAELRVELAQLGKL